MRDRMQQRVKERLLERQDVARQLDDLKARGVDAEGLREHLRFLYLAGRLAPGVAGDWEHQLAQGDARALGRDADTGLAWYQAPRASRLTDATGGAYTTAGAALVAPGRLTPEVRAHESAHAQGHDPAQLYAHAGGGQATQGAAREARAVEQRFAWWHAADEGAKEQIRALWDAEVIWQADWEHAMQGLRSHQWRAQAQQAFAERFTFRDADLVARDARIGVDPAGIRLATRSKGWLAKEGVVKSDADLAASIKGIQLMGEVAAELTMFLAGSGVADQISKIATATKKSQAGAEAVQLAAQSLSLFLGVCDRFADDDVAKASIRGFRNVLSQVQGKAPLFKSMKDAAADGADVLQSLGLALRVMGDAIGMARAIRETTKEDERADGNTEGLDVAMTAMQRIAGELGKAMSARDD